MKGKSNQITKIQETQLRNIQTEKQIRVTKTPQNQQKQQSIKKSNIQSTQQIDEKDVKWPFFHPKSMTHPFESFWEKKQKYFKPKLDRILFKSTLLRVGKKKKSVKAYLYILSNEGILSYYKNEQDSQSKGYLYLKEEMIAHLIESKSQNDTFLAIQIEKKLELSITLFDQKNQMTVPFFDKLKQFSMVSGFDRMYQQLEILGKGSFASVYKVKNLHNKELYAAKVYFQELFESNAHKSKFVVKNTIILLMSLKLMIQNEIMVLRKIKHINVIGLYEIIQERDRLILIMECVPGGDLYQLVKEKKKLEEKEAAYILKGVAEGLHELHKNNFVHRDLKLENIMLTAKQDYEVKLVDFGFAETINDKELVSKAGTPGYIPPEIFKLQPYLGKGDVFSVGVIFYSLVSGLSCFKGKNYQGVLEENRKCEINFDRSVWKDISSECKHIIKKMLEKKPLSRYTCADILQHDWIIMHTRTNEYIRNLKENQSNNMLVKQMSQYNQSDVRSIHLIIQQDSNCDFQIDFSRNTNELKSFYYRNNSQKTLKTLKTLKSNMSIKSNKNQRSQFQSMKSQLSEKGKGFHQVGGSDLSFDEQEQISQDFDAVSINNMMFLKVSSQIFNLQKKPDKDKQVNEAIRKKKAQYLSLIK